MPFGDFSAIRSCPASTVPTATTDAAAARAITKSRLFMAAPPAARRERRSLGFATGVSARGGHACTEAGVGAGAPRRCPPCAPRGDVRITRRGSATWRGGPTDAAGTVSTESGALDEDPYCVASRVQRQHGTNTEELIAAAHAACFTMALAKLLDEAGLIAERMDVAAEVTVARRNGCSAITAVHLTVRARVGGVSASAFAKLADRAKAECAISKSLRASVTLGVAILP